MQDFGPVRLEENPVFTQLETFPFLGGSTEMMLEAPVTVGPS